METYLFINPHSGQYRLQAIESCKLRLQKAGSSPQICMVAPREESGSVFDTINSSKNNPLVIVAAGDGTINAVVNGLMPGVATLAVLPLGTSNVLARELGISSLDDGLDRIVAGKTRTLSIGALDMAGEVRRFVLMAGIGFDGAVVRDVSLGWKRLLKQGAYGISALKNSLTWDSSCIQLRSNGINVTCHSVIICNASRYGGQFTLARNCSVFSPGLTALCIQKNSRRTYLRLAYELLNNRAVTSSDLLSFPINECEILGTKPIQIDGDYVGSSPARLSSLADFCRIIV